MLLLDLSGVAYHKIINFYADEQTPDIESVRYALFKELLEFEQMHGKTFGRMIICADSKPYWRTRIQPSYKMNRLAARAKSTINSEAFYKDMTELKKDILKHTDYMLIDTEGAEADDTIAVLTEYANAKDEPVLIISSDKDMLQLQLRNEKTYQFSPNRNKLLTLANTEYDLLSHVLKGDTSDGIPNVFSPDDHFMIEGDKPRQKSVTKKLITTVKEFFPDNLEDCELLDEEAIKRFHQNQELIDTTYTPKDLADTIVKLFEEYSDKHRPHNIEALLSPFEAEEDIVEQPKESVRL